MGDQPFLQDAPHVHVLPGLGRVQLHLQRSSYRQRSRGESRFQTLKLKVTNSTLRFYYFIAYFLKP